MMDEMAGSSTTSCTWLAGRDQSEQCSRSQKKSDLRV